MRPATVAGIPFCNSVIWAGSAATAIVDGTRPQTNSKPLTLRDMGVSLIPQEPATRDPNEVKLAYLGSENEPDHFFATV